MERPHATFFLALCLVFAVSSANPLAAAWQVARMAGPWTVASHVASAALGYGHQVFLIGAKSRAIKELFEGVNEVKQCISEPPEPRWRWRRVAPRRRDVSGCVTGPVRAAAAFYLIKTNMHAWLWPQVYMHEEGKRNAGSITGRVTRGMLKRMK